MNCHKIVAEALASFVIDKFLAREEKEEALVGLADSTKKKIESLVESPSKEILESLLHDEELETYMKDYDHFCNEVINGSLWKTGQFWYSYMKHVWLILQLVHAVKMNDFMQYTNCISLMPDLFFRFGGQNYACYLTYYSTYLANIEESHPGATEILKQGAISMAR